MAQAFGQPNKGTLVPGQMITVNKYTVQVDRYLSQGGFAHVYLVRTATPVYNTTYHVLKRMAVPDEKMLTEVKQEVDVMRLLKGHPNIVHLIDAASHRLPDGSYEVFILMEFCPGGGIIDMMNRRLRERLTESEILTIFVDVCEGVAHMHNARPALLHRDLKVENILQSSPTSYKLCDFGSSARPSKVPNNADEIRALEMDLNRHTTLQYRAPEMVDLYLRRPVDEKSDVWALGVLLYKLCYYTTPFEEHGPLAILNVMYKIPPYPVYSPQMNALIGSMLREHGMHRPSVFELLDTVHRMRGSKSQFHYSPRVAPPLSPSKVKPAASPNALDSTISYRAAPQVAMTAKMTITPSISPSKNAGVQARDKVLEAIAPMRRGRPARTSEDSNSTSTSTSKDQWLNDNFAAEEDDAWKSAMKTASSSKPTANKDDAWSVPSQTAKAPAASQGFGDDFSKTQWDGKIRTTDVPSSPPVSKSTTAKPPSLGASATLGYSSAKSNSKKDRDAFEGLGLAVSGNKPAPTLGEARKLRTGLATMTTPFYNSSVGGYAGSSGKPYPQPMRPSPSPQPHLQPPQTSALKPSSSGSSWQALRPPSRPASSQHAEGATPESRFPSLEELDAQFTKSTPDIGKLSSSPGRSDPHSRVHESSSTGLARRVSSRMVPPSASRGQDGVRSEQVTGYAMREPRKEPPADYEVYESKRHAERTNGAPPSSPESSFQRSTVVRKQRSAEIRPKVKETLTSSTPSRPAATPSGASSSTKTPRLPPRPSPSNKDWLTGDDDEIEKIPSHYTTPARPSDAPQPVLRQSPTKRASFIEKSSISIPEASVAQHDHAPLPPPSPLSTAPSENTEMINRANRVFPPLEINTDRNAPPLRSPGLTDNWSPVAAKMPQTKDLESSSSADEGPEDVDPRYASPQPKPAARRTRKGRQSSVHDLVDLWGGGTSTTTAKEKEKESTRSTITPITPKTSTTKAQRRTTMMAGSTPTESKYDRPPSSSSASMLSNDPGRTPQPMKSRTASGRHEKQPSSPISPRGRPQSMFIFPSSESPAPSSAASSALSAPDEPKPRTARRTSINDMVQKFEAIDASARVFGSKATSLKSPTENGRLPSIPTGGARPEHTVPTKATLPVPEEPVASQAAPVTRTSPRPISPLGHKEIVPPPRTSSIKPAAARKQTVDDRQGEVRSPSPDKPYQGVGKLIDQWQRKAAEPDVRAPTPKRGGLVAKRAGLISGGAGRG
ncbi:hypothetical protein BDZ89DRAFT_1017791 [Hymenopellis radicata]|nr:hypothetical protein BDZ89DRAFT_1017791 [Hymenopellis radicata]